MIKAVFFDLGGTLYSYSDVPRVTTPLLHQANERLGTEATAEHIKKSYQTATVQIASIYSDKPYYLHEDLTDCLTLKKDALKTLRTLQEKGLYLSIVSNIDNDMLGPIFKNDRLHEYLDHAISSEDAQSCKPEKKIFQDAVKLSGWESDSIGFVGDSPEHDMNGAASIGLKTALISDGGMPPPLQAGKARIAPDFTINHLSDLIVIVEKENN